MWYPRGVAADWAPYTVGRWVFVAPWGWTWVEAEPWGFTPFHYGRWARVRNRWGWIPGPVVVRPVYSPALVVFIGGGGAGFTGWFPLGPREPFVPWYRTSAVYVNRVNVTNIYNRNNVEVRNIYNNRTTNIYVNKTVNVTYINRGATVAVPQNAFGNGQMVRSKPWQGNQSQLAKAPVMNRPPVAPGASGAVIAPGTHAAAGLAAAASSARRTRAGDGEPEPRKPQSRRSESSWTGSGGSKSGEPKSG